VTSKHITHWIGGKPWDGEAERHGDVYNPARETGCYGWHEKALTAKVMTEK
jgi:hypothetical protein